MIYIYLLFLFIVCSGGVPAENIDRSKRSFAGKDIDYIRDGLYVGDQNAAGDIDELIRLYNITAILNVAWDLDIRYPEEEYIGDITHNNEHLKVQYAKIGLVDAFGNSLSTLASAVFTLDQYFRSRELLDKDKSTYKQPVKSVLVHCHSGQSRSVTVAALHIYFKNREEFDYDYLKALQFVKKRRNLLDNLSVPREEITNLALQLVQLDLFSLFEDEDGGGSSS